MSEIDAFKDIPFDDDADEVKTWKGLALSAIMDLRRYAHDAGPERRMVSAEAYEADAERIHAHAPAALRPENREEYAVLWDGPPRRLVTKETVELALSAIKASQERDYYDNFAKAQRELEALL